MEYYYTKIIEDSFDYDFDEEEFIDWLGRDSDDIAENGISQEEIKKFADNVIEDEVDIETTLLEKDYIKISNELIYNIQEELTDLSYTIV